VRDYAPPVNSSEFLVFHNSERREGHLVNYLPNSQISVENILQKALLYLQKGLLKGVELCTTSVQIKPHVFTSTPQCLWPSFPTNSKKSFTVELHLDTTKLNFFTWGSGGGTKRLCG